MKKAPILSILITFLIAAAPRAHERGNHASALDSLVVAAERAFARTSVERGTGLRGRHAT